MSIPHSSRAKRHRRSSRVLSWSRRHKFLAAMSMVVIAAFPASRSRRWGMATGLPGNGRRRFLRQTPPPRPGASRRPLPRRRRRLRRPGRRPRHPAGWPPTPPSRATSSRWRGRLPYLPAGAARRRALGPGRRRRAGDEHPLPLHLTRSLVVDDAVEVQAGVASPAPGGPMARSCAGERTIMGSSAAGDRAMWRCRDRLVCARVPARVDGLSGAQGLATGTSHAGALLGRRAELLGRQRAWTARRLGRRRPRGAVTGRGVTGARQVVAGHNPPRALIGRPGSVRCWGDDESGQAAGDGARVTRRSRCPA